MIKHLEKVISFTISIAIIITTGSIPGYFIDITKIEIGLALFCIVMAFIHKIKERDIRKIAILAVFSVVFSLLELMIYPKMILEWLRIPFLLMCYSLFCCVYNKKTNIINCYYSAFMVLCMISTLMYIFVEVLHFAMPYTVTNFEWLLEYNSYGYVYFQRSMLNPLDPEIIGPITIVRNCGFYTEPGLYAVFIVLNLYIYLFVKNKKNWFHFGVLLFALLTTVSTTGWLAFLMMVAFKIVYSEKHSNAKRNLMVGSIVLLAVTVIGCAVLQQKATNHVNSYTSRGFDLIQGLKLFLQSPIWGWGYKNSDIFSNVTASFAGVRHVGRTNSNGVMCVLYQIGLLGAMIYFVPAYLYIRSNSERHTYKRKKMILFCLVLGFLIMGEPIQYAGITLALVALFIANSHRDNMRVSYEEMKVL